MSSENDTDSNVIQLRPSDNAALALRSIADLIEEGELANECTVIVGTDIFHCGESLGGPGRAAEAAIFNMTMGIHKLMRPVIDMDT